MVELKTAIYPDISFDERYPIPQTEDEIVRASNAILDPLLLALAKEPKEEKEDAS